MLRRTSIEKLDDYFIDLGKRKNKGIYFYRINGYNRQIHEFIQRYYETARLSGVIIEGKLQNPDTNNLAYYNEIMGNDFQMSMGFMMSSLKKWLPRMNDSQRENVAGSIYDTLMGLKRAGKNDNMLKNAYIKFMCWLYYKFERIVNHLGDEKLPKILYEGTISTYELLLMNVLAIAGCDIVLLQYQGDAAYQKIDPDSTKSIDLKLPGMNTFPPSFSLKQIRADIQETQNSERLYGPKPQFSNCTNAWIYSTQYQCKLPFKTQLPSEIAAAGFQLFKERYVWTEKVRAITIRAIDLIPQTTEEQLSLMVDYERRDRRVRLEDAIEDLRRRFGKKSLTYAGLLGNLKMPDDGRDSVRMPGLMYQ